MFQTRTKGKTGMIKRLFLFCGLYFFTNIYKYYLYGNMSFFFLILPFQQSLHGSRVQRL